MSQCNVSAGDTEPNIILTDNQVEQHRSVSVRAEAMGNTLGDVMTFQCLLTAKSSRY